MTAVREFFEETGKKIVFNPTLTRKKMISDYVYYLLGNEKNNICFPKSTAFASDEIVRVEWLSRQELIDTRLKKNYAVRRFFRI